MRGTLQCHDTWFLWNFLAEILYAFDKKSPSISNFSDFECSNEIWPNSLWHFWNRKVKALFKFCITVHCHERQLLYIFLAQTSYTLDKNSPSKWNFWTFEWLGENSPNSSCHFWNQESVFLQTLHHSSVSWNITLLYFFI